MIEEIILKSKKYDYISHNKEDEEIILTNPTLKLKNNGKNDKYLILQKSEDNPSIKFPISEFDYYYFLKNNLNITKLKKKKHSYYKFHYFIDIEVKEEL